MCIGGQLGADVDLSLVGEFDAATQLFSESNSRFVVSVAPEKTAAFEVLFAGLPVQKIGTANHSKKLVVKDAVEVDIDALVKPFKSTLHGV
jgi:phosphoribosylformylglycinamidine synthase